MLGFAANRLNAYFIDHAILRHVFEAIAHGPVGGKTVVKHGHKRDLAIGRAVSLGNEMSEDCGPRTSTPSSEKNLRAGGCLTRLSTT